MRCTSNSWDGKSYAVISNTDEVCFHKAVDNCPHISETCQQSIKTQRLMTAVQTSTSIVFNGSPQRLCFDACQPEITTVNSLEKATVLSIHSQIVTPQLLYLDCFFVFFCCYDTSSLSHGRHLTAADARRGRILPFSLIRDKSGLLSGCKQIKS